MKTRTASQRNLVVAALALGSLLFAAVAGADTGDHRDRGRDGDRHDVRAGRDGGHGRDNNYRGGRDDHRRDRDYRRDDHDRGHDRGRDWGRGHDDHRDYHWAPRYYYGHRVSVLPSSFVALSVGGVGFYYSSGTFYRPFGHDYLVVPAPIGAVVYSPPPFTRTVYVGPRRYFYGYNAWYGWDAPRRAYVVVDPVQSGIPEKERASVDTTVYAYPTHGQSAEQADRDRYECYQWAVQQTGFDPSRSDNQEATHAEDYLRANSACLSGRGYAVK